MRNMTATMVKVGGMALLALALVAFIACSGSSSGSEGGETSDGNSEVAEHVDGAAADTDVAADTDAAEHTDADGDHDAAADTDAAEHTDADGDEEANAYLEAAPKESLTLIEMTSFAYAPSVIEVGAGEVLEIAIQNAELALHDFTIDKIDADVHVSYLGGTGQHEHQEQQKDADVHFALTEPASGVVHLKIHEPGEYVFYCTVPGHREGGMEGTLIVQ
ncbi:MAG: plastocyanin/azurin family copper-binding protein [Dehalococcoidia bacterium]